MHRPSPQELKRAWNSRAVLRIGCALTTCALAAVSGAASAQTGYVGILGGGPVYKHVLRNINEIRNSGFNELIVWSVEVNKAGDLNLNGEFPLTSAGGYIGQKTYPHFLADLNKMKQGSIKRITFSVGSSNYGDWEDISALVKSQGTGPDSILYKDFAALKAALPVDAIDFDDENGYDGPTTSKFALMLGTLGYKVTINPYTENKYWISLVSEINRKQAGLVDGVHLQTFAGGMYNDPCQGWNFGSVPVYPGISDQTSAAPELSPAQTQAKMKGWHTQCGITGGWVWIFDQIAGTSKVQQYAHAITTGVGGAK